MPNVSRCRVTGLFWVYFVVFRFELRVGPTWAEQLSVLFLKVRTGHVNFLHANCASSDEVSELHDPLWNSNRNLRIAAIPSRKWCRLRVVVNVVMAHLDVLDVEFIYT